MSDRVLRSALTIEWQGIPVTYGDKYFSSIGGVFSITYEMASGGSHAWDYVFEWVDYEDVDEDNLPSPSFVYVSEYPFTNKVLQKDVIPVIRQDVDNEECKSIALMRQGSVLPINTDEYQYHRLCMDDF